MSGAADSVRIPGSGVAYAGVFRVHDLERQPYEPVWHRMRAFTDARDATTPDELWLVEHPPVFTQGQAGREEHLLMPGDIPVVQVDRGGQVTYHGPGQLVAYPLLDIERLGLGVRELVQRIERALMAVLAAYGLQGRVVAGRPGVYVGDAKIASLGLRVRRGCCYHGLAFNVDMDLAPFARINPCGYRGQAMTDLARMVPGATMAGVKPVLIEELGRALRPD